MRHADCCNVNTSRKVAWKGVKTDQAYILRNTYSQLLRRHYRSHCHMIAFCNKGIRQLVVLQIAAHCLMAFFHGTSGRNNASRCIFDIPSAHNLQKALLTACIVVHRHWIGEIYNFLIALGNQFIHCQFDSLTIVNNNHRITSCPQRRIMNDQRLMNSFQNRNVLLLQLRSENDDSVYVFAVAFLQHRRLILFAQICVYKAHGVSVLSQVPHKDFIHIRPQVQLCPLNVLHSVNNPHHLNLRSRRFLRVLFCQHLRKRRSLLQAPSALLNLLSCFFAYSGFSVQCKRNGGLRYSKCTCNINRFCLHLKSASHCLNSLSICPV